MLCILCIVHASGLRKFVRMHKDCKTGAPDIMRGYTIYVHYATRARRGHLKAKLFVDYIWIFLIFLCRYPHLQEGPAKIPLKPGRTYLCEGIKTGKDGTSNPCRVLALRGSVDLDLDIF